MWIRSQDKEILIDANKFHIETVGSFKDKDKYEIIAMSNRLDEDETLGTYSTKEKALKVMDMIQDNILSSKIEYIKDKRSGEMTPYITEGVFFMPQEEEVK